MKEDWPTGQELIAYWEADTMSGEAFDAFYRKYRRYLNHATHKGAPEYDHIRAVELAWWLIRSGR